LGFEQKPQMNQLIKAFKNLANLSPEWSVEVQRFVLVKNYIRIMQHPFIQGNPGY